MFFDPEADTPKPIKPEKMQADILAVMKAAGTPAVIIYAYKKTGLLLMEEHIDRYPPDAVVEWNAAVDEYYRMEDEQAAKAQTPPRKLARERHVPPTDIPELKANPFNDEDKQAIFKVLDAVDVVLAITPMTVRARMEVGAALVALAADAAYDSAIAQGQSAEEALERAAIFANLALDRAQEIFDHIARGEM